MNMSLFSVVIILSLLLIFFNSARIFYADHPINSSESNDNPQELDILQICCSWSAKLSDGILTYSLVEMDDKGSKQAIVNAIEEWDSKIEGLDLIEENQDPSASDIQIVFGELDDYNTSSRYYDLKNKVDEDLTLIPSAGWTHFAFDNQGFIDRAKIIISSDVFYKGFDKYIIEQIAKHEIGHVLGLGHASNEDRLMANIVIEDRTGTISQCEISGVWEANHWRFIDVKQNPEHPKKLSIQC